MVVQKMKDADEVVFATPIYYYEMSGQMKVLLDSKRKIIRCTTYKAIGPADQSRQGLLLTCIWEKH
ncbi:NAD(P)H-dependent oxidoreductase [uncultured Acidaminococcus sp.]|uniref:NAD(P)H-dependent oxidoreductase n=1 Tax=uncultured Acidaminococcus sp. TaxID=352152 RepID=UPI00345953FE